MEDSPKDHETKSNSATATNDGIKAWAVGGVVGEDNSPSTAKGAGVIAHEDLQCQKPDDATSGFPAEAKKDVAGAAKDAAREIDDSQLFDLGLLESPGLEDSLTSNARRTLRKHFVVGPQQKTVATTPVQQPSDKLIEVSPESDKGEDQSVEPKVSRLLSLFQDPPNNTQSEFTATMSSSDAIKNLRVSHYAIQFEVITNIYRRVTIQFLSG